MLKRTILILLICAFATVACDKIGILKKKSDENAEISPVVIQQVDKRQNEDNFLKKVADLESQVLLLGEENRVKGDEILNLKATLSTAEASLVNVSQELINLNKTKRMLSIIVGISIFLNIMLAWVILRRKNEKLLALPRSKADNIQPDKNNSGEGSKTTDDAVKAEESKDVVKEEQSEDIVKAEESKKVSDTATPSEAKPKKSLRKPKA